MKHRVNITIDEPLHKKATVHAKKTHHTDFSGLITKLIVEDLTKHAALNSKPSGVTLAPTAKSRAIRDGQKTPKQSQGTAGA